MQTITLNTGAQMPILGFGVYQMPDALAASTDFPPGD